MKTNTISKCLLVIVCLLMSLGSQAQGIKADTLKVSAGNLSALLGDKKDLIISLTLKGKINGTDITTIRSMAKLSVINLLDADIVKGGVFNSSLYNDKIDITNNEVPEEMFYAKDNLTVIILPENVTAIGLKAFSDCPKLASVSIPDGVISFGTNAFYGCSKLLSVTIPAKVTTIDYGAFQECSGLKEVHCKALIPVKITTFTFYGINFSTCKLYVPKGTADLYKIADGWKAFKNIIEE